MLTEACYGRLFAACAPHFDPLRIAPDGVVAIAGEDESVRLIGWDDDADGWRVEYAGGGQAVAREIADPCLMRRVLTRATGGDIACPPHDLSPDLEVLDRAVAAFVEGGGYERELP